jgi:hypothetical protein
VVPGHDPAVLRAYPALSAAQPDIVALHAVAHPRG